MPLGGKLPKLTTELDGDLSGLADAFAEGTAMAEAYAAEVDQILSDRFRDAGHNAGGQLRDEMDGAFHEIGDDLDGHFRRWEEEFASHGKRAAGEFGDEFERETKKRMPGAGRRAGSGFFSGFLDLGEQFQRALIPLIIGAVILAAPAIGALIASAVAVGLGLGFAALGTVIAIAMLPKLQKAFAALANPVRAMFKYAITGAFDDALAGVPRIIKRYLPGIGHALRDVFDAVAPLVRPLAEALMMGADALINALAVTLQQSQPAILKFIETIPEVAKAVGDMLVEMTKDPDALVRFIGDAAHFLEVFLVDTGKVTSWLASTYDWIVKLNDKGIQFIGFPSPSKALEGAKLLWGTISNWFKDRWHDLGRWFSQRGSDVGNWFSSIPDKIKSFLSKIPGFFLDVWHGIIYGIGWLAGKLLLFFVNLPTTLLDAIKAFGKFLWTQFKAQLGLIIAIAKWAVDHVIDWFKGLPERSRNTFKTFKDRVVDFFKNAPDWLYNAGKDLVRGLVHGIESMWDWAVGKVEDFGHHLAKGFKDALGISSPSKVFSDAALMIPMGIVEGLRRGAPYVARAMAAVTPMPGGLGAPVRGGSSSSSGLLRGTGGTIVVDNTISVDGSRLVRVTTVPAQRRASRSGTTGLGNRTLGFGT